MKKLITTIILSILSFNVFATTSTEFVKTESGQVLSIVQKNKEIKSFKKELNSTINIDNLIDFNKISKMTLGKNWRTATEEQKVAFVKEFREFLINFYGNAMFNFKDAQISYKSENIQDDFATVKTVVTYKENGQTKQAKVDYMLSKNGESWKMIDVIIEGITLTLSYKDSFGQIINNKGMDGLITELRDKNIKNKG